MATESFSYVNVISDDVTAQKFLDALQESANKPFPKPENLPNIEASINRSKKLLKQLLSRSPNC